MSPVQIKRILWLISFFASLIYITGIFVLTHMPLDGIKDEPFFRYSVMFWVDKIIQCVLYAGLVVPVGCVLFPLSRDAQSAMDNVSLIRITALMVIIGGVAFIDEYTQPFFGRRFEVLDIAADFAGIVPGICLFLMANEARHQLLNREW